MDTEELERLPENLLLKIVVELDPDILRERTEEGWTTEDLVKFIKKYIEGTVGNRSTPGGSMFLDSELAGIDILELGVPPGEEDYDRGGPW